MEEATLAQGDGTTGNTWAAHESPRWPGVEGHFGHTVHTPVCLQAGKNEKPDKQSIINHDNIIMVKGSESIISPSRITAYF